MSASAPRNNVIGGAWLIADMSLNIWALAIVKWLGAEYTAPQIVFVRAVTGFLLLFPIIVLQRDAFRKIDHLNLHLLRVGLSVVTLTASFFAISRVPLAVFTTMNFTRPIVTMVMAALILKEAIGPRRWAAAAIALVGVLIAANPQHVPWTSGLAALVLVVITGSAAIIATRKLREAPPIVLMTFYTAGLAICTAPFAVITWIPVVSEHLLSLLLIGAFSQIAQLSFLRAHYHGEAGFLSVIGYTSLVLSVTVGFLVFEEIPSTAFAIGATLVICAAVWVALRPGSENTERS
ncbi:MAG: DMT family transporter [Dinoroseobacter sp.]|nr:DMT family transporter [Dinoroseobacter sp.]